MSTLEILIAARKLIANGWVQGVSARRMDCSPTFATDPEAVSFCATSAIHAATSAILVRESLPALRALRQACPLINPEVPMHPSTYNDLRATTQADVLALYDRAIASTRQTS